MKKLEKYGLKVFQVIWTPIFILLMIGLAACFIIQIWEYKLVVFWMIIIPAAFTGFDYWYKYFKKNW
jgi:hypothetical protein